MRRSLVFSLALGLAMVSGRARAETEHDRAIAAFDEARKLVDAGSCDAAITKLNESLAHEPSVGARLSMADCYEKTDPLTAWTNLKEAARLAYLRHDERLAVAERRAAPIEAKLPRVHVVVSEAMMDEPGFELRVDGAPVDRFAFKDGVIAMKPGAHTIEASSPRGRFAKTVNADATSPPNVVVTLTADVCATPGASAPAASAPYPSDLPAPGATQRALGLVIGGMGIAGLALGGVFGVVTLNKRSSIESLCGGNLGACNAPPGSLDAEREAAKNAATVSTVGFIVGGAALAGGALLYLTAPRATPQTGNVRVAPTAARNGAGLTVVGSW